MDRRTLERRARRALEAVDVYIGPASYRGEAALKKAAWRWVRQTAGERKPGQSWASAVATAFDPADWHEAGRGESREVRELYEKLASVCEQTASTRPDP